MKEKWTEYNQERANKLLDEIGLTQHDNEGFRLLPNGKKLKLIFIVGNLDKSVELITSYWKDVGINTIPNVAERSRVESMAANNELMVTFGAFGGTLIDSPATARFYTSIDTNDRGFAPLWAKWYASGGKLGEEPPPNHPLRDVWAAWDAAQTSSTLEKAKEHIKKMVQIHKENVWVIGIHGEDASFYIVSKKMGNVPAGLMDESSEGPGRPVQFFFKQ